MLTKSELERFKSKVEERAPHECWPWTGGHSPYGYGAFYLRRGDDRRNHGAHRIAYIVAHGIDAIPGHLSVCHTCDQPNCVNPTHLFLGTQQTNLLDCVQKGRWKRPPTPQPGDPRIPRGDSHWNGKFTAIQVLDIRRRFESGQRQADIMRTTGISRNEISRLCVRRDGRYRCWAHVVP